MDFNVIQILLVAVWTFIIAIDQFNLLESLYQPIVTGAVVGAILGDLNMRASRKSARSGNRWPSTRARKNARCAD